MRDLFFRIQLLYTQKNKSKPQKSTTRNKVECKGEPRIKLSEEMTKVTLPGRKCVYRLYGGPNHNTPLVDYMTLSDEEPPTSTNGEGILCRDPFQHQHRIRVFPSRVKALQTVVFDGGNLSDAAITTVDPKTLSETRKYVQMQLLEEFPEAVTRYENPTKHDVMVSPLLYAYLHKLWENNAPIPERR